MTYKLKRNVFVVFAVICIVVMAVVLALNYRSSKESEQLLEESIQYQMVSIAMSARLMIDPATFSQYNSAQDIRNNFEHKLTLSQLRALAEDTGALYIYALKEINGKFYFIFDTDPTVNETFIPYEPSGSHLLAFKGKTSVNLNLQDEYGSYHNASIPIYSEGKVVGIVSVDIDDSLTVRNTEVARRNQIILTVVLILTVIIVGALIVLLSKRVNAMQKKLERMAHFDRLTNLPNRQYLLGHLEELTEKKSKQPFALFFIDLDNFKKVNDNAGHDAGDALLINIGNYLQSAQSSSQVFRPSAGNLTVAARIGGDEFIIVMPDITNARQASTFAQELLSGFSSNVKDKSVQKYDVGLSIGVALYPENSENFHVLIKYADIAMYNAKRSGKNTFMVYSDDMKAKDEDGPEK